MVLLLFVKLVWCYVDSAVKTQTRSLRSRQWSSVENASCSSRWNSAILWICIANAVLLLQCLWWALYTDFSDVWVIMSVFMGDLCAVSGMLELREGQSNAIVLHIIRGLSSAALLQSLAKPLTERKSHFTSCSKNSSLFSHVSIQLCDAVQTPLLCPCPPLDVVERVKAARLRRSSSHAQPSVQRVLGGHVQRVVLRERQHHCISLCFSLSVQCLFQSLWF